MFHFFKGKDKMTIGAPAAGTLVPISKVQDPTFGEEILGKGAAIIPTDGKIYAPADGTIDLVFDTLHALSMTTTKGVEILIHIGLDTVSLKGAPFHAYVGNGDKVKKGDLLMTADLAAIKAAGLEIITPVVICNSDNYSDVICETEKVVTPGETILTIKE